MTTVLSLAKQEEIQRGLRGHAERQQIIVDAILEAGGEISYERLMQVFEVMPTYNFPTLGDSIFLQFEEPRKMAQVVGFMMQAGFLKARTVKDERFYSVCNLPDYLKS